MTRRIRIGTGLLLAGLVWMGSTGALAAEQAKPKGAETAAPKPPAIQQLADQQAESRVRAHKMFGHMNLAALALDSDLPDAARSHLETARGLASQLLSEAPALATTTRFRYGKISYDVDDETKDYYVPVFDDRILLSDYKETYHAFRETDIEEREAGVVEVTLSVDLREVERALDAAAKDLAESKPARVVADDLRGVYKNAIRDETIITNPIWAIRDNLSLARNLLREGQFRSARLLVERASARLAELEKSASAERKTVEGGEFKQLNEELAALGRRLKAEDPTLTESIDGLYQGWMKRLQSWVALDLSTFGVPL